MSKLQQLAPYAAFTTVVLLWLVAAYIAHSRCPRCCRRSFRVFCTGRCPRCGYWAGEPL